MAKSPVTGAFFDTSGTFILKFWNGWADFWLSVEVQQRTSSGRSLAMWPQELSVIGAACAMAVGALTKRLCHQ